MQVRHLVERLCKRCGYEAVAAVWPESEAKLLTAIRKDFARKARRKAGRAGEGSDDGAGADARSRVTLARTARASEWGHSAVFSDDDDGAATAAGATGAARSVGGKTATTRRGAATMRTGADIPLTEHELDSCAHQARLHSSMRAAPTPVGCEAFQLHLPLVGRC